MAPISDVSIGGNAAERKALARVHGVAVVSKPDRTRGTGRGEG